MRAVGVHGIPSRLGASEDGDPFLSVDHVLMLPEILAVEDRPAVLFLAVDVRHPRLRHLARRDDKPFDEQLRRYNVALFLRLDKPPTLGLVLCREDLGLEPDTLVDAELACVGLQIVVDYGAGNMFSRLDAEAFGCHGEVWVLVGAEKVVGLETRVDALSRPDTAKGAVDVEDRE